MSKPDDSFQVRSVKVDRYPPSGWVPVWDWWLRLWHWALAASVLIAWFTPTTHDGLHRIAGYTVIGLLVVRIGIGLWGRPQSRFRNLLPRLGELRSYLTGLTRGRPERYLGLNPAGVAMLVLLLMTLAVSSVTGAMQVTVRFFGVWWVEDTHSYASDGVIILAIVHVVGTILVSILQRENLPWAMISGRKRGRDDPSVQTERESSAESGQSHVKSL